MAMTPKEIIAVVQHFDAGGEVEYREPHLNPAWKATKNPCWNFYTTDYRPKPKSLDAWTNVDDHGNSSGFLYKSVFEAAYNKSKTYCNTVHMREVVDEDS